MTRDELVKKATLPPEKIKETWVEVEHRQGFPLVQAEDYDEDNLKRDVSICEAQLRHAIPIIQKAERERLEPLANSLYELVLRGDYSSGKEFMGADEGRVLVLRRLKELGKQWQALEEGGAQ